ncbi:T6SS effector BTH_I2691 family protein [Paraburkholderia sp. BL25I1N1]|uniref:T6SS effector BTH_I2691 family protein n=1 Tax=Paraburkholderia sp. BL25I1N1 TaxID=1938804 RepID=UPI000D07FF1D|nr:T6SS effector BTH_I2691 family protein [Paraburkholderia sp. BL25I1N1]PRY03122.1 hypothetical protein B0G73_117172 [Paraburkholderia sp. BL25I1N1]
MLLDSGYQSISDLTKVAAAGGAPVTQCKMCEKKGLPILPVRYSAFAATRAHGIDGVPILMGGNFGQHVMDIASRKTKYTLRSLRYGFVYVFYPKTSKWQCYAVTKEGYVYDYPLDAVLDRSTEMPFSCTQTGHPELAQCITIENAEKAGTVYLAFSTVQWTKTVRDRYAKNSEGCRTKRMQAFDAAGWFASPGANVPHATKATDVQKYVAEYKGGAGKAFVTSPFPFRERSLETAALNAAMDHLAPHKGAVFALWDPIGITQELNIENKYAYGVVMADHQWGTWSAEMVENVKEVVQAGAVKSDEIFEQMAEGQMMEAQSMGALWDGGKQLEKNLSDMRANQIAELPKVREEAWKEYATAVSETAATEYRNKMKADLAQEGKETWTPLSMDHAAWLGSPNLAHVFHYDHDEQDPLGGAWYAMAFHDCIAGASARKEGLDLLYKWLQGKSDDHNNLLLRAMALNQAVNAQHLLAAGDFPYTELRETCAKAIETWFNSAKALESKAPRFFADFYKAGSKLIYEIGAPVAKLLSDSIDTVAAKAAVLMISARSGKVVIEHSVRGTQSQWVTYFARQMWEMMPADKRPTMKSLKASIRAQFTTKGAEGPVTEVPQFIIVDRDGLQSLNLSGTSKEKAASITNPANKLMLTDEVIEKEFAPTFRKLTGGEVAGAGIGAVFAAINVFFAAKEFEKSTHFNSTETMLKFRTSIVALGGGAMALAGNSLEAMHKLELSLPRYLSAAAAERLLLASRLLAAPAALIGVWYDGVNAKAAWKDGHVGLFLAYSTSAAAGLALTICVTFGVLTSLILPLTILLIVIGLIIMWFKERELKEFLGRSFFGTNKKDDRYTSFAEEQKAYNGLGA